MKWCYGCKTYHLASEFHKNCSTSDGLQTACKKWQRAYDTEREHRLGIKRPMSEARDCPSFLGVHIAERVLSSLFDHIEKMPYGHPGYDFLCGRGKRIDCKSSCLRYQKNRNGQFGSPLWQFRPHHNKIADYFLLLAFDSRESLKPQHVWMVPGEEINDHQTIAIVNLPKSLGKWSQYEKPIGTVLECCDMMRASQEGH
jgi:hypothetical protein